MNRVSSIVRFAIAAAALALSAARPAAAQLIDFETLPGGVPTTDLQFISTQYAAYGVTFELLDRTTHLPIGSPRIAKAGAPLTAFEGCLASDTPHAHLGLGQSFLTDNTSLGIPADLRVSYASPVVHASGLILDVDCRTDGGPPCEQWTITALDGSGTVVQTMVLDAPVGAPNPGCLSPAAGPGDADAMSWSLGGAGVLISAIEIRYTGAATDVGLAFDHFSVSSLPEPVTVTAAASADTVCAGEETTLSPVASFGFAPYSFEWQEELAPGWWSAFATGAAQVVRPVSTTRYRVTVTDAFGGTATSAPLTVAVTAGVLCAADLLVSCNTSDNVIRYGFASGQATTLVGAGSGGLSGASDILCDGDGHLLVSSQDNDSVRRYDISSGDFIDTFVSSGSGGLNVPVGLALDASGHLCVASYTTNSVLRYDGVTGAPLGAFVAAGAGGLDGPTGITFGPDGHLYVSSRDNDRILRYDGVTGASLGAFVTAGSGGLDAPRGLAFGPDGNLYVAEEVHDSVSRYDGATGAFVDVFVPAGTGGLDHANDVAFGPDGLLYVASYAGNAVLSFAAGTGAFAGALPSGLLQGPAWVTVGCRSEGADVPASRPTVGAIVVEPGTPNPFNPRTTVAFTLASATVVRVSVIDMAGSEVATLLRGALEAGRHAVEWNGLDSAGREAPSGVYFVRVEGGGQAGATKVALLR